MADEDTVSNAPATDSQPSAPRTGASPRHLQALRRKRRQNRDNPRKACLDAVLKVVPATTESDVLAPQDDTGRSRGHRARQSTGGRTRPKLIPTTTSLRHRRHRPPSERKSTSFSSRGASCGPSCPNSSPLPRLATELQAFRTKNTALPATISPTLLHIGAALQSRGLRRFYKAVAPYVRTAQEVLGVVLPKDLSELVRAGADDRRRRQRRMPSSAFSGKRAEYELQTTTAGAPAPAASGRSERCEACCFQFRDTALRERSRL